MKSLNRIMAEQARAEMRSAAMHFREEIHPGNDFLLQNLSYRTVQGAFWIELAIRDRNRALRYEARGREQNQVPQYHETKDAVFEQPLQGRAA